MYSSIKLTAASLILHLSEPHQHRCRTSHLPHHSLLSLDVSSSTLFSPQPSSLTASALQLSFQPCFPLQPPKVPLDIHPICFPYSALNRKGSRSNETEQQGWAGPHRVIKPRTHKHGATEVRPPGGQGPFLFEHVAMCWEGQCYYPLYPFKNKAEKYSVLCALSRYH